MDSLLLHDSPSHYTIEEMQQHPHPPSSSGFHQIRDNVPSETNSPYRRPHSNPNPALTDQFLYPAFQGGRAGGSSYYHQHQQNYQPKHSSSSVSMNLSGVYGESSNLVNYHPHHHHHHRADEDSQQPFLYHNPLHYGSSMEDISPESAYNNEKSSFLYPDVTPTRQLGSGSGESGYHGGYHDTNPSSSISSSTSTNPRTPSRHGSSNFTAGGNRGGSTGACVMSTSVSTVSNSTYEDREVRHDPRLGNQIHQRYVRARAVSYPIFSEHVRAM
jgi:hypothetical protein